MGGSPEWLSAVSAEPARAPWSGSPMWPNLRSTRTHERKVTRVFRAGPGKCGACAGAPSPREKRSGPAGCSTYLPLEQRCSDAVENERVGAQLQVHEIEPVSISRRHPAPPEQLPQRAHRPILHARVTSSWQLRGSFSPNQPRMCATGTCTFTSFTHVRSPVPAGNALNR